MSELREVAQSEGRESKRFGSELGFFRKFANSCEIVAGERASAFLGKLTDDKIFLQKVYYVYLGLAEFRAIEHAIDRAMSPKLPFNGATIEEHRGTGVSKLERKGDDLYLDGKKIVLHLEEGQKNGGRTVGHKLRELLSKMPVLDANAFDYLMEHPELIPENWKVDDKGQTRYIFFWGTIFRSSVGDLCVRYLDWNDGQLQSSYRWLDRGWGDRNPAAVLAS